MIIAFTGQPGAGKTIGAIEYVLKDNQFENRNVYTYNIRGINVDGWKEIDKQQLLEWWKLPEGSVIIVDEAQDIMRPRAQGKPVPEHIQRMEKHRHLGIDIVLTFQFPTQIDTVVRHLITDHFHSHRAMGIQGRTVYHWDELIVDPMSRSKQNLATSKKSSGFPKEVFDLYESASLHTAKPKLPWKLLLGGVFCLIIFVVAAFSLGTKLYSGFSGYADTDQEEQGTNIESSAKSSLRSRSGDSPTLLLSETALVDYLQRRVPVLKNDPRSAPIYDELNVAKTLPKSYCIASNAIRKGSQQCKCYTQQATWQRGIDVKQCLTYIKDGYEFDYTVEDTEQRESEGQPSDNSLARAPFDLVEPEPQNIDLKTLRPQETPRRLYGSL